MQHAPSPRAVPPSVPPPPGHNIRRFRGNMEASPFEASTKSAWRPSSSPITAKSTAIERSARSSSPSATTVRAPRSASFHLAGVLWPRSGLGLTKAPRDGMARAETASWRWWSSVIGSGLGRSRRVASTTNLRHRTSAIRPSATRPAISARSGSTGRTWRLTPSGSIGRGGSDDGRFLVVPPAPARLTRCLRTLSCVPPTKPPLSRIFRRNPTWQDSPRDWPRDWPWEWSFFPLARPALLSPLPPTGRAPTTI